MAIPIPTRQLFIDGEWREPALKRRLPIINPSTEEIIGASLSLSLSLSLFLSALFRFLQVCDCPFRSQH
jgi:hypothetical protein